MRPSSFAEMPRTCDLKLVGFVLYIAVLFNLGMNSSQRINSPDCGISKPAHGRILDGKKAHRTQMPWMVHIELAYRWNETFIQKYVCGGSIISPRYILTAAHCVDYAHVAPLYGVAYYNTTKYRGSLSAWIEDFIPHPKFEMASVWNDVALVRVENPLRFDDYVRPVCLPTRMMQLAGKRAVVSGWGLTSENGTASKDLLYVRTRILPFKKCKVGIVNHRQKEVLNKKNTLCALNPGKGSCKGDSGGPLTVKSRKGRTVQVGIVSYGKGCGRRYDPGMYARVDNYMRWIKQQISNPRPPRWHVPTLVDKINNSGRIFDMFR